MKRVRVGLRFNRKRADRFQVILKLARAMIAVLGRLFQDRVQRWASKKLVLVIKRGRKTIVRRTVPLKSYHKSNKYVKVFENRLYSMSSWNEVPNQWLKKGVTEVFRHLRASKLAGDKAYLTAEDMQPVSNRKTWKTTMDEKFVYDQAKKCKDYGVPLDPYGPLSEEQLRIMSGLPIFRERKKRKILGLQVDCSEAHPVIVQTGNLRQTRIDEYFNCFRPRKQQP